MTVRIWRKGRKRLEDVEMGASVERDAFGYYGWLTRGPRHPLGYSEAFTRDMMAAGQFAHDALNTAFAEWQEAADPNREKVMGDMTLKVTSYAPDLDPDQHPELYPDLFPEDSE